jgi:hypothetical protein
VGEELVDAAIIRSAFLAVDWPTWRTAPIWCPCWSKIAYSLLISMSLPSG